MQAEDRWFDEIRAAVARLSITDVGQVPSYAVVMEARHHSGAAPPPHPLAERVRRLRDEPGE